MHLNCVDGTAAPLGALHLQGNPGGRAHLACKNCRRDNKKVSDLWRSRRWTPSLTDGVHSQCDDQRPCRRCVVRGDECVHVARRPKHVKVRCQRCREANKRCEDVRPCYYCSTLGEACVDLPRKGKGRGMRVKAVSTSYVATTCVVT